jgi:menaquinone-specific isochorismate synthase
LNLFDLKNILLKELCQFDITDNQTTGLAKTYNGPEFITFEFQLDSISLQSLCQFTSASPLCYLSSKDSHREDFGVGTCRRFKNKEEFTHLNNLLNDENLVFFGGQKFDDQQKTALEWHAFGDCFYFLPRIWFSNDNSTQTKLVIFLDKIELKDGKINEHVIFEIENLLDFSSSELTHDQIDAEHTFLYDNQVPGLAKWEENISQCLQRLNQDLEKVVLSRKQIYKANITDVLSVFLQPHKQNTNHYVFLLKLDEDHLFISLTPEKLFKVDHSILTSDAIAGTRPRGNTERDDQKYEAELLESDKELREHRVVSHQISKAFEKTCSSFERLTKEQVLKLNNVQHLISEFRGELNHKQKYDKLINLFHPTPAVGGHPKKAALELIREIEGYDRGLYSAPVGIISKNYTEVLVAIRSALLHKSNLHVYGGAGIVLGSDANEEWSETQKKMNTIREYIL